MSKEYPPLFQLQNSVLNDLFLQVEPLVVYKLNFYYLECKTLLQKKRKDLNMFPVSCCMFPCWIKVVKKRLMEGLNKNVPEAFLFLMTLLAQEDKRVCFQIRTYCVLRVL